MHDDSFYPGALSTRTSTHEIPTPSAFVRPGPPGRTLPLLLLAVHGVLLAHMAYSDSPTWDEIGHFPAGIEHWQHGDFRLYNVNPPLVRAVAVLPAIIAFKLPNTYELPGDR